MPSAPPLPRLDPKESEQIMEYFKQQVLLLKEKALLQASVREEKKLLVENARLKKDITDLKTQLQVKQKNKLAKALFGPAPTTPSASTAPSASTTAPHRERGGRGRRGERKGRRGRLDSQTVLEVEPLVSVSRLDLRIGRIASVRKHPLAETLYVQEVDVGEPAPRTVVSALARHLPLEELEGRLAVLLCNLHPSKLRGVVSQAMVLCGSSHDHMEPLAPPTGAVPGDRVTFHNYPGEPDSELPPRERVWERVQKDLQTDARGVANYKGAGFEVRGKGLCKSPTLTNSSIK